MHIDVLIVPSWLSPPNSDIALQIGGPENGLVATGFEILLKNGATYSLISGSVIGKRRNKLLDERKTHARSLSIDENQGAYC